MRILPPITSKKTKMDSFESILSIVYSAFHWARDTQGILTNSSNHPFSGYFLLQGGNYMRIRISCKRDGTVSYAFPLHIIRFQRH